MQDVSPFRVLFFDSWTKGVANCHRIMKAAPPGVFDFKLLHISSLNDYNEPSYCVLDSLPCYDIKTINRRSLAASIAVFSPHVVINFTIGSIMDRVVYLTCAKLGIPTIYVDHGAITDSTALRALCQDIDRGLTIWAYLKRVPKFCRIIPWYFDVRRPKPLLEGMHVLWTMVRTPKQSTHFPDFASELWPTLALAYNNDSANHLSEVIEIPKDRIRTVGNPELDAPFQYRQTPLPAEKRRKLCDELGLDALMPIAFYADEGLARSGIFGWTNEIGTQNLRIIASACGAVGLQLLVRPRQGSEQLFIGLNISDATVVFDRRLSLVDSIGLSCASIGCLSTVHETAIAMKKPLITPLWFFNNHPASHLPYMKYNAAHTVATLFDLKEALRAASEGRLTTSAADYEYRRLSHNDGRAAQRIIQGIMDVVGVPMESLA